MTLNDIREDKEDVFCGGISCKECPITLYIKEHFPKCFEEYNSNNCASLDETLRNYFVRTIVKKDKMLEKKSNCLIALQYIKKHDKLNKILEILK